MDSQEEHCSPRASCNACVALQGAQHPWDLQQHHTRTGAWPWCAGVPWGLAAQGRFSILCPVVMGVKITQTYSCMLAVMKAHNPVEEVVAPGLINLVVRRKIFLGKKVKSPSPWFGCPMRASHCPAQETCPPARGWPSVNHKHNSWLPRARTYVRSKVKI